MLTQAAGGGGGGAVSSITWGDGTNVAWGDGTLAAWNVSLMRAAEVSSVLPQGTDSDGGSDRYAFRWPVYIGQNMKDLALSFQGWYQQQTSNPDAPNSYSIVSCSIEAPNGTVAPVTFSGLRTQTINPGDVEVQSDVVPASAFGQTIARDNLFWVKGIISVTASNSVVFSNVFVSDNVGAQVDWYANASTTPSSTDSAGPYIFTGASPSARNSGLKPVVVGHPVVDGASFFGIGDSIMSDVGDSTGNLSCARAFFTRALSNNGTMTNCLPGIKAAISGITSQFYSEPKIFPYAKYCRYAVDELGVNDMRSGFSAAQLESSVQGHWAGLKVQGIEKIIRTGLNPDTTSTDNWATLVNQTAFNAQCASGGDAEQFNAWILTQVGTGVNAVVPVTFFRDNTNTWEWTVNGVANFRNTDDVHPNSAGHSAYASATRTIMLSL